MQRLGRSGAGGALRCLLQSELAELSLKTGSPAPCLRHHCRAATSLLGSAAPPHAAAQRSPYLHLPSSINPHGPQHRCFADESGGDGAHETSTSSGAASDTPPLQEYAVVKLYQGPHIRAVAFFMRCGPLRNTAAVAASQWIHLTSGNAPNIARRSCAAHRRDSCTPASAATRPAADPRARPHSACRLTGA